MINRIPDQEPRNKISVLKKAGSLQSSQLFLMKGDNDGKAAWYYLLVDKLKISLLEKDIQQTSKAVDIAKYGKIIRCGWGTQPPEYIVDQINKIYR